MTDERIDEFSDNRSTSRYQSLLRDLGGLIVSVALALAVAGVAGLATLNSVEGWYAVAEKPLLNPPGQLFGPVWAVLYSVMAVAAWLVWRQGPSADRTLALRLYGGQLALNAGWTPVFFLLYDAIGGVALWIALGWIVVLDFIVLATVIRFWPLHRAAAVLIVPYWAWLLYATALNASIAMMNG